MSKRDQYRSSIGTVVTVEAGGLDIPKREEALSKGQYFDQT